MKRLIVILCVVGFAAALPMSHSALAAKKAPAAKVRICHVNSANDVVVFNETYSAMLGRVTEVSENAVNAHLAHGDSEVFFPLSEEVRTWIEEVYEISVPNADCYFTILN